MAVENMPDERLLCFYENIRQQVEADRPHRQFVSMPNSYEAKFSDDDSITRRSTGHSCRTIRNDRALSFKNSADGRSVNYPTSHRTRGGIDTFVESNNGVGALIPR
jgi:hypothetical protein